MLEINHIISILLLSIGVAMDAFAVSIERGLSIQQIKWTQALLIAFLFGSFQTIMPLIGLKAGEAFFVYISAIDHWFALLVLSLIGFKMIYEAIKHTEEENQKSCQLTISSLLLLSIATSIDSLAVGLSLTATNLPKNIVILSMGIVTFAFSFLGVFIGKRLTSAIGKKAEIIGGLILIAIGCKIFIEHVFC